MDLAEKVSVQVVLVPSMTGIADHLGLSVLRGPEQMFGGFQLRLPSQARQKKVSRKKTSRSVLGGWAVEFGGRSGRLDRPSGSGSSHWHSFWSCPLSGGKIRERQLRSKRQPRHLVFKPHLSTRKQPRYLGERRISKFPPPWLRDSERGPPPARGRTRRDLAAAPSGQ